MFLPGSTRLFCTSRFYVLAKTREALLEIPLKKEQHLSVRRGSKSPTFWLGVWKSPRRSTSLRSEFIFNGLSFFFFFFFPVFLKSQECYSKLNFPLANPCSLLRNLLLALWNLARAVEPSLGSYSCTFFEDVIKAVLHKTFIKHIFINILWEVALSVIMAVL